MIVTLSGPPEEPLIPKQELALKAGRVDRASQSLLSCFTADDASKGEKCKCYTVPKEDVHIYC